MKEDELLKYIRTQEAQLAKHAETINLLNTNQQVLVKKLENFEKNVEVGKRVDEIVDAVKKETEKVETKPAETPATPVKTDEPVTSKPAEPATTAPAAEPAATPEPTKKEEK